MKRRGFIFGSAGFCLSPMMGEARQEVYVSLPGREMSYSDLRDFARASLSRGIPLRTLLAISDRESRLDRDAVPIGMRSSALGWYQFLTNTWLEVVWWGHADLGISNVDRKLRKVERNGQIRFVSSDRSWLKEILDFRRDAFRSSVGLIVNFERYVDLVERRSGYRPKPNGEVYLVHLLGPGDASKVIASALRSPGKRIDHVVSAAALQNRSVFYNGSTPKTSKQTVVDILRDIRRREKKFEEVERAFASVRLSAHL